MSTVAEQFREFFRVGPANNDHLPALRVAIGVALPLLVLLAFDRKDLAIYAVFGAFTGIYGRGEPHQLRLEHQLQAGAYLTASVLIGIALSAAQLDPWVFVAVISVLTALGSVAADRLMLRPSGPFFGLFSLAACASIPLTAPAWQAALACVAAVALSVAIGFAGWFRSRDWRSGYSRSDVLPAVAAPRAVAVQAVRYLLAIGVAGAVALFSGLGHTYWAMLAASIPLAGPNTSARVRRGLQRILGTFAGLAVAAVLLWPHLPPWLLILVVVLLQFGAEMFVIRHYGLALLFITPLALLMTELAHPVDPGPLLLDRGLETLIGALVGIAVVLTLRDP